ncbi:Dol-P-Glc:Glc(2)Man(9)GlcNAc(2)-PP-Dol alpha-1,2-glucosyltransferase [Halotydeus destructor]|nr:Dol-P-Glc:Glc(2)Man(9)GlcNAc(2)-PP-Dol alpha-1,2-glucosyltransferase [Halotydeus destructor]
MTPLIKRTNGYFHHEAINGTGGALDQHDEIDPKEEAYKKIVIVTAIGYVCSLLTIFLMVNDEVPQPYMDEIFHIEQARAYCVGNFTQWNPKITTPPGLYLTTLGFLKPFSELYAFGEVDAVRICPTFMLRFVNLLFAVANAYVIYLINLDSVKDASLTKSSKINLLVATFSMATFPPLFFFSFLYYTDSGSLFFVLLMYWYHVNDHQWIAPLFGAISLLYRQTNIVWMFFLAAYTSTKLIANFYERAKKKPKPSQVARIVVPQILQLCGGYAIVGFLFVAFVIVNRGIVVGDRSAHEAALNLPQFFYFLGFIGFFSFPVIVTSGNIKSFVGLSSKRPIMMLVIALLVTITLIKFTYVHPYLLADNRHYPFYVWRRIFGRNDSALPFLLIPVYMYIAFSAQKALLDQDDIWKIIYTICVIVSLVPQQLLEFRYFLIPYMIWRLNVKESSIHQLVIEFILNTSVNCFTLYMFLQKPFKWNNSPELQRFMW